MKLIIEDDEGRKTVVPIVREDVEITIGRQDGNTIRLTERNVSRRHAKLARRNGSIFVEDLGSYNGVRVNGDRIEGVYEVNEGDLIQIGDYDLAVQYEDAARPARAAPAPVPEADPGDTEDYDADSEEQTRPRAAKADSTSVINAAKLGAGRGRTVVDVPVEQAPRISLVSSEMSGREYACIRSEIKIGRTEDNDIAIDHRSLSRNHCKVVREEGGEWKILDLQSSNGVKVNGEQYAESVLRSGDLIELGHLKLRFLAPGDEAQDFAEGTTHRKKPSKTVPLAVGAVVLVAALAAGGYLLTRGKPASPATADPTSLTPQTPPSQPEPIKPQPPEPNAAALAAKDPAGGDPVPEDPPVAPPAAPDARALKAFQSGKALFGQGRFEAAEKKLAEASEGGVSAAQDLLVVTRAEIESQAHFAEAQKKLNLKDWEGARGELAAIPPDSSFAPKASRLQERIEAAADRARKQEEAAGAKALLDEQRHARAEQEKAERAERAAQAAAARDSAQPEPPQEDPAKQQAAADLEKGKRLASDTNKRYKEAITFLERALAADKGLGEAHLYLGTCYARINNIKRGATHYEEFVHMMPNHPSAPAVVGVLKDYFKNSGERPRWPLPE